MPESASATPVDGLDDQAESMDEEPSMAGGAADVPASSPAPMVPQESPGAGSLPRKGPPSPDDHPLVLRIPVGTTLAEAERLLIIKTLEVAEGNKQRAARILGISRRGLYTKLASYGEHVPAEETTPPRAVDPPAPSA
jgi:DNA-binding NtrC family response regulator